MNTAYEYSPSTIDQVNYAESPYSSRQSDESENPNYRKVLVQGKTNFLCLISSCDKLFKFKSEIDRHLKVHSGTRPFTCEFANCNKSFKRADALNSHMRIHTSTVTFNCPVENCTSHFTTKSALNFHLQKHNGKNLKKDTKVDNKRRVPLTLHQVEEFEAVNKRLIATKPINTQYINIPRASTRTIDANNYVKLEANFQAMKPNVRTIPQNLTINHIGGFRYEQIESTRSDITSTDISSNLYLEREGDFDHLPIAMMETLFEKEYAPIENLYRNDIYNHLYEKVGGEDIDMFLTMPQFH